MHYWNPETNQYVRAIRAVGNILQSYDCDKKFPLYGFGGKVEHSKGVNHCFAMNGNIFDPEVHGIENVIATYQNSINRVALFGPTWFSQIIHQVAGYCEGKTAEES